MAGLAEAVQGVVGQPASVRVGVVDSINPIVVSAQGVAFENVGILGDLALQPGDSVALLGQSSAAGSDPASWLVLERVRQTTAPAAISVSNVQNALASTASLVYVTTAVVCSTPFVAPNTGRILLAWRGGILTSGAGECFIAPQITNPDGTLFLGATDPRSTSTPLGSTQRRGASTLVSGLTPGLTYTTTLMQRTTNAGSPALAVDREVSVFPAA